MDIGTSQGAGVIVSESSADPISILKDADFTLGNCAVIPYNPPVPAYAPLFPDDYLSQLYSRMKSAHILETTMCGMPSLGHNPIVTYLAGKPVFAAVEWDQGHISFRTLGFGFIVQWIGIPPPNDGPRSAFAAYAFFPEAWGQPEAEVLAMLGLARMFSTYSLRSVYSQRYAVNRLTARFTKRFGFKDIATIPELLLHKNGTGFEFTDCVASRLTRDDFSDYVAGQLSSIAAV